MKKKEKKVSYGISFILFGNKGGGKIFQLFFSYFLIIIVSFFFILLEQHWSITSAHLRDVKRFEKRIKIQKKHLKSIE